MNTLCIALIAFALGGLIGIAAMAAVSLDRQRDRFHQPIRALDTSTRNTRHQDPNTNMAHYYISNTAGLGYVVRCIRAREDGYMERFPVRCFGDRQSDAMEFRDDCNAGIIDDRRIRFLASTYTEHPYQYYGKGILRRQLAVGK